MSYEEEMKELSENKKERRKEEAIKRLELWKEQGLEYHVLQQFKKKDSQLWYSDAMYVGQTKFGGLFWLNDLGGAKPEWIKAVSEFEEEYNATVYHVIHDYLSHGTECLFFLYVSNSELEWEMDKEEIKENHPFIYAHNLKEPIFSEFGNITCVVKGGGLVLR